MNTSTVFDIVIRDRQKYVIGYSTVHKTRCEIYNFVSPTTPPPNATSISFLSY